MSNAELIRGHDDAGEIRGCSAPHSGGCARPDAFAALRARRSELALDLSDYDQGTVGAAPARVQGRILLSEWPVAVEAWIARATWLSRAAQRRQGLVRLRDRAGGSASSGAVLAPLYRVVTPGVGGQTAPDSNLPGSSIRA